ncbi:MAG: S8 family serine peptidase [Planctomycetes bacterium]|nr:S8 family serine peptidase [Planctomycetota bacterium]
MQIARFRVVALAAIAGCACAAFGGIRSDTLRNAPAPFLFGFGQPDPGIGIFAPGAIPPTRRILVRFEPDAARGGPAHGQAPGQAPDSAPALAIAAGATRLDRSFDLVPGLHSFEVPSNQVEEVLTRLRATPGVRYAESDGKVHIESQTTPWGITRVAAPEFWAAYGTGSGARVAVLDTGFDIGHPDLPVPVAAMSFVAGETYNDGHSHGSHVAGTILALDNDAGVVGVAPSLSLIVAKVLSNDGYGEWSDTIAGVEWSVAQGAKVLNMSFSGSDYSQALQDAFNAAIAAGCLPVAAAGNQTTDAPRYPAYMDNVMSVAAVTPNEDPAWFSNFGPRISVAAPGTEVESTVPLRGWQLTFGNKTRVAQHVPGSQENPRYGRNIYCDYGWFLWDFPSSVSGNIAHIRDSLFFPADFVIENAWDAGAIAVVLSSDMESGYQPAITYDHFRPVWYVEKSVGDEMILADGANMSITSMPAGHGYDAYDGTSMACPHVVGAAGALFGSFVPHAGLPALPPQTVRWVLERTADQPGTPPRNDLYGYGIINLKHAGDYLHGRIRCAGDLNADLMVEDTDFQAFIVSYNALVAPGGPYTGADLNGDAVTDDSDFQIFVQSYDALVCP